jgi:tetratricopeptide (TPR) repeat protein
MRPKNEKLFMKYTLLLATFFSLKTSAQNNLSFNNRFVECEDKWVAFSMNKDSSFTFGFIYIDAQAGLTLNREGNFKINQDNTLKVEKLKEANIKVRLQANNVKVAIIPVTMYKDLEIEQFPNWLKFYKTDTTSAKHFYDWGFMYNGWNECAKALTYLEKAEKINPNYKGLSVELSFSYNCLKQYNKAEIILSNEINRNPSDAYVNKEYIYTLINNSKIDAAIEQFEKSIKTLKDVQYNAENCFNIMGNYYTKRDKQKFNLWYSRLKIIPNRSDMINNYAEKLNLEVNK